MRTGIVRLVVTAALYWCLSLLALHLTTPLSVAAPLFPAAAIAMTATLIAGPWGAAGTAVGSLLLNAPPFLTTAGASGLPAAIGLALAATLQAVACAWAFRRWVGWPDSLADPQKILRFVAIATLGSMICASISLPILHATGRIAQGWASHTWWRWWLGDSIGILAGFPLIQLLLPPDAEWRARRWKLGLPLAVALVVTATGIVFINRWEGLHQRAIFERDAEELRGNFRERLRMLGDILDGMRLFVTQSDEVNAEEFAAFANPWNRRVPEALAQGIIVSVAANERERIEGTRHAEGELDYRLFALAPDGQRQPLAPGATAQVIFRIEPHADQAGLLGLDISTHPQVAKALQRAESTGEASFSDPFDMPFAQEHRRAVALIAPVEARITSGPTPTLPHASAVIVLIGLNRLTAAPHAEGLHVCLTETGSQHSTLLAGDPSCENDLGSTPRHVLQTAFPLGGRHWTLSIIADAHYIATHRGQPAWLLPSFGWTSVALLVAFLLASVGRARRIEEVVAQRTMELRASESRFRDMLEEVALLAMHLDRDGRITFCNASLCKLLGYEGDNILGLNWFETFMPAEDRETAIKAFRRHLDEQIAPTDTLELFVITRTGMRRLISWSGTLLYGQDGVAGVACIGEDISARREAQRRLEETSALLSAAIEQSPSGIVIASAPTMLILTINPAANRIRAEQFETGLPPLTRYEQLGWSMRHPDGQICSPRELPLVRAVVDGEVTQSREFILRPRSGKEHWITLNAAPIRNNDGEIIAGIEIFNDISELKTHQSHLEHLAHFDVLTRLPNRALLGDRLLRAMEQSRRGGLPLAVAYLDLDGFKAVNDAHGHEAGDQLLVEVAARLLDCVRETDTVARLGGDEFVILLAQLADTDAWRAVIDRVLANLATPFEIGNATVAISGSIGLTLYPDDDSGPEVLLRHADLAMYVAKQSGRNRTHLFDPEHDRRTQTAHARLAQLEAALDANEFELHYQPRVDMRHGSVQGVEALLRWRHPEDGLIGPAEFLPAIEGSPFALRLGHWVLDTAIAQWTTWYEAGIDLKLSVNLASEQLHDPGFPDELAATLELHPTFHPDRLDLELRETIALQDMARVTAITSECTTLGVRIAIDGFGAGHSPLTSFRRLPTHALQIDCAFVRDMLVDLEGVVIVEGVVRLAQAFRRELTAVGVETVLHGIMLLRAGCHLAQGNCIAPPMPGDALPTWLVDWRPDPLWCLPVESVSREDIALLAAELEHRQWVDQLCKPDGMTEPSITLEDCHLSRWLSGTSTTRYDTELIDSLRRVHRDLHNAAAEFAHATSASTRSPAQIRALRMGVDDLVGRLRALWLPPHSQ